MRRPESGCGQQLPGWIALREHARAGLRAGPPLVALAALLWAPQAAAHAPATAIGRAVEAFESVPVSYEPGAAVSEVEAGGFPSIVGDNARVAFMPESAAGELAGAPSAIAEEIAREAKLDGTLVVLVGSSLGAWSSDISAERLDVLVREAQGMGGSAAARTETLVRNVQAEPAGRERGGVAFVAVVGVLALAGLVALARHRRRRHRVGA